MAVSFSKFCKAAVLAASFGIPALALADGPVTINNFSFEDPALATATTTTYVGGGVATLPGWSVFGDNVQLTTKNYAGLDLNASLGNQWLDLTGTNEGFGKGVSQSFGGNAGQFFLVQVDIGKLFGRGDAYVEVNFNGEKQTFSNTTAPGTTGSMNWVTQQYHFVSQATNTLSFSAISGPNGTGDRTLVGIDNVRVTAVPEPETYAMLLAGLGAVGFMSRRRRNQV